MKHLKLAVTNFGGVFVGFFAGVIGMPFFFTLVSGVAYTALTLPWATRRPQLEKGDINAQ